MSGGSLDYVGYTMESGGLVFREWAIEALPDRLSRCLGAQVQELSNEAYDSAPMVTPYTKAVPPLRPITDTERADVARYGEEALRMMRDLLKVMEEFKRRAVNLAPLANVLSRRRWPLR